MIQGKYSLTQVFVLKVAATRLGRSELGKACREDGRPRTHHMDSDSCGAQARGRSEANP